MGGGIWRGIKRFLVRTDGPTTVEYAVILVVIVITALFSISYYGDEARAMMRLILKATYGTLGSGE